MIRKLAIIYNELKRKRKAICRIFWSICMMKARYNIRKRRQHGNRDLDDIRVTQIRRALTFSGFVINGPDE